MFRQLSCLVSLLAFTACGAPASSPQRLRSGEAVACLAGHSEVAGPTDCVSDGDCYPLASGRWCTGAPTRSGCEAGHMSVPDQSGCLQDDAVCYPIADGTWCTGEDAPSCPLGLMEVASASDCLMDDAVCFRVSESLFCTGEDVSPPGAGCREGEMSVAGPTSCLQDDAVCYALEDGSWCTGPADATGCPEGYTGVPTMSDCIADGECFEIFSGWCTSGG